MLGIFIVLLLIIAQKAQSINHRETKRMLYADCSVDVLEKHDAQYELMLAYERQIANIEGAIERITIDAEKAIDMHNTKRLDTLTSEMDKLDLKLAKIKVQREKLQNQIDKKHARRV